MSTRKAQVILIGGFATERPAYAAEIAEIERSGKEVLFLNPRGTIEEKVRNIERELDREVDLVAYSQGCMVAAIIASHCNAVRRVILINPVGLIGKDSPIRLICRFARQTIEEVYVLKCAFRLNFMPLRISTRVSLGFLKNCLCNPHIWRDVSDIAKANIVPLIHEARNRGVEVVLLSARNDRVFPADRIEASGFLVDRWAMFVWKDASHNVSYLRQAGAVRQILEQR